MRRVRSEVHQQETSLLLWDRRAEQGNCFFTANSLLLCLPSLTKSFCWMLLNGFGSFQGRIQYIMRRSKSYVEMFQYAQVNQKDPGCLPLTYCLYPNYIFSMSRTCLRIKGYLPTLQGVKYPNEKLVEVGQWFHMPKTYPFHGHFDMESVPDPCLFLQLFASCIASILKETYKDCL